MTRSGGASRGFGKVGAEPQVFRPSSADIVAAVESLYVDQVRPYGRILLKRLGERAAAAAFAPQFATISHPNLAESVPRIDANRLRKVCERCRQLCVEVEESGEYCALLAGRPQTFVDASVNTDCYPQQMWLAAAAYFSGPQAEGVSLPGGRYACAQALVSMGLPFLVGYSLGQVCHIVQLAISTRRILGYLNGQVVPHRRSEAVVKEMCAQQQQPANLGHRAVPALPLATLAQARACLWEMLSGEDGQESVSVPLPNVKRIFRSRFSLDLSETALGHSRLCELLQDPRFCDVCVVCLHGNGYIVRRAEGIQAPPSPESWPAYQQPTMARCPVPPSPEAWPMCERSAAAAPAPAEDIVPPTPQTWPEYRMKAAPARAVTSIAPPPRSPAFYGAVPSQASQAAPAPPTLPPKCHVLTLEPFLRGSDSDASESTRAGEHLCGYSDSSSTASPQQAMDQACLLQWPCEWAVGDVLDDNRCDELQPHASIFAAEPLGMETLGMQSELTLLEPPASTPLVLQDAHWSALMSPSVLADDGCIGSSVKNTFIHVPQAAVTPLPGSRRRARSVPRDVGSGRNEWEAKCDNMLFRPAAVAPQDKSPAPTYIATREVVGVPQASTLRRSRICWSPATPGCANDGLMEALRLWSCA